MIEKLKKKDFESLSKVYKKGLEMETPPGYLSIKEIMKKLENENTFVYKENKKILGLILFELKNKKIKIDFIASIKPNIGIGKKLMKKLADFAIKKNMQIIYTNMSSRDERAMNFYYSCGFKKYGKYQSYQKLILYRIKVKPEEIIRSLKCNTQKK